ncbi:MAG TPA: S8 family peptidase [Candidatus Limnocylindrales bacterium]|nr:S8 family peptidase [Candidatus Limnocylindrales bacterium]
MYFEPTDIYPDMDPRLQRAVDEYQRGQQVQAAGGTGVIGVIALVTDVDAWSQLDGVTETATIVQNEDGWIVTASVAIARIESVRRAGMVKSLKAAQPLRQMLDATVPDIHASAATLPPGLLSSGGEGVVIGIVDSGLAIAHRNLRKEDGTTRVDALWDQSAPPVPDGPVKYGRRYGKEQINAALQAVEPHLALLGFGAQSSEDGGHGTHVADIAAGNGRGTGKPGVAPKATIVFVKHSINDIGVGGDDVAFSTLGDSRRMVDAVRHIFKEAGDRPCVVNISLGTNGGPHDGSNLIERSIDDMVAERPGRAVVISAGNAFAHGIHASGAVPPLGMTDLSWSIPANAASDSELEVWYPGNDRFGVQLLAPDGTSFGPIPLGRNGRLLVEGGKSVLFIGHRRGDPNNGDNLINLFMDKPLMPGTWTLRLYGEQVTSGRFHAWIERDDSMQAKFLPPHDSSHTLGSMSCGKSSIVVGSYDARNKDKALSGFTGAGPTRDGRPKPEISAPGHRVIAAHSRTVSGTTVMSGTSMAAPAVAGVVALVLAEASARGLSLDAKTLRRLLFESARLDPPFPFVVMQKDGEPVRSGVWHDRYGYGRVDAAAALRRLDWLPVPVEIAAPLAAADDAAPVA